MLSYEKLYDYTGTLTIVRRVRVFYRKMGLLGFILPIAEFEVTPLANQLSKLTPLYRCSTQGS